jgi:carboxymethylenebutenolidase
MDQKITVLEQDMGQEEFDRRQFLKRLGVMAGGTAAGVLLTLPENDLSLAEIVSRDDPRLVTEGLKYPGATGAVSAYLARPKGAQKLPAVLVVHENRGLTPHIKDVSRRLALEGFLALAPDGLTPLGGTPEDPEKAPALIQKLDGPSTLQNYLAAVKYLKTDPGSTGRVGVVGFCWGGAMANQLAVNSGDIKAAVPYYGLPPAAGDVPKIKASLLLHYAENDERINKGIPAFEEGLKKASIDYKIFIYKGTQHAFNNDTSPARYNKEAAGLAWGRTIAFLKEKLAKDT